MAEDTNEHGGVSGWLKSQFSLTNLVLIGSFLFAAGNYWTRQETLIQRVEAAERREANYVRQDVAAEQYRALYERLNEMSDQLRQIRTGRR